MPGVRNDEAGVKNMSKDGIYVCAELGVNWLGNYELLKEMISDAAMAGADAVKLQYFDSESLERGNYANDLKYKLTGMILDPFKVSELAGIAHSLDMDLVVTPFSEYLARELTDMMKADTRRSIDGFKVRAKDYLNAPLVEEVKKAKVPVYISFPVENGEVKASHESLSETLRKHWFNSRPPLGYRVFCVPKYPPKPEDMMLNFIDQNWHGFSNHLPDVSVPLTAAAFGIRSMKIAGRKNRFYLEVHLMPDIIAHRECLDYPVSFSFEELETICRGVEVLEEAV